MPWSWPPGWARATGLTGLRALEGGLRPGSAADSASSGGSYPCRESAGWLGAVLVAELTMAGMVVLLAKPLGFPIEAG